MRVKISVFVHGFSISLFVASNVRTHVQVMGSRLESGTVLWGILSRARVGSFPAVSQLAHSNDDHHGRRLNAPRPSFFFPRVRAFLSSVARYDNSPHLDDLRLSSGHLRPFECADGRENRFINIFDQILKESQTV